MLKYQGVLIVVKDMAVSRHFYEDCLGQKVLYDFGVDVAFEGGLTIHQKDHFQELLGGERFAAVTKSHTGELYFDSNEIETLEQRLKETGIEFIHPIREQPWAQRTMRIYDPDGHVIEIGELMEAAVQRLYQQGSSLESICQRTGMPRSFVEEAIKTAE